MPYIKIDYKIKRNALRDLNFNYIQYKKKIEKKFLEKFIQSLCYVMLLPFAAV